MELQSAQVRLFWAYTLVAYRDDEPGAPATFTHFPVQDNVCAVGDLWGYLMAEITDSVGGLNGTFNGGTFFGRITYKPVRAEEDADEFLNVAGFCGQWELGEDGRSVYLTLESPYTAEFAST